MSKTVLLSLKVPQPFFQFVDEVPGFAFQCLFQNRVGSSFPIRKTQTPRFTANRNTSDPFLLAGARDTQTEGLQALSFLNWHKSDAVFCGVHKSHSSSLACPYLFLLLPLKRTRYFPFLLSLLLALFKSVLILKIQMWLMKEALEEITHCCLDNIFRNAYYFKL